LSSVSTAVRRRQRVGLVDEEDSVERAADRPVGLGGRVADVLPDEPGAIDLHEVPLLEQAHRAVHLREQACDRRLAGPGIADEDEVLRGGHLGQPVLEAAALDLKERHERAYLLLDRLEADERVELRLQLFER
jgi:hypothetical protein